MNTFLNMALSVLWIISLGYIPKDTNLLKSPMSFAKLLRIFLAVFPVGKRRGRPGHGWLVPGAVHILLKPQFPRRPPQRQVPENLWELTKALILAKKYPHACLDQLKRQCLWRKKGKSIPSFFFLSLTSVWGVGSTGKEPNFQKVIWKK